MVLLAPKITNDRWLPLGNYYKKFHYYRMFAIRNFVLFALRYLVLFAVRYFALHAKIIWITNSEYSITTSFLGKCFWILWSINHSLALFLSVLTKDGTGSTVRYASIFAKKYGAPVRYAFFVMERVQYVGTLFKFAYGMFYVQRAAVNEDSRDRARRARSLNYLM